MGPNLVIDNLKIYLFIQVILFIEKDHGHFSVRDLPCNLKANLRGRLTNLTRIRSSGEEGMELGDRLIAIGHISILIPIAAYLVGSDVTPCMQLHGKIVN